MFVRAKRSVGKGGAYEYLQVVRSYREDGRVRQQVVATLGRRDRLVTFGDLDGLLRSLARFSEKLRVVERVREDGLSARTALTWGPALVFGRLWETQGLPDVLDRLARGRRFQLDVERAAFAMARQRLESALFHRDRDLFSKGLDLVFIDTTSLYVYRDTETAWRKWGYSRDRRGDLPQFVLCVVVDAQGWPIAWEILPGNTADKVALEQVVTILRERFDIRRAVVVADRGMISEGTIQFLAGHEKKPFDYVLGCRMRNSRVVSEEVLARAGRYARVAENLEVKEVVVDERRYVACRNEIEARKDAAARQALVAKLEQALAHGPKSVIGNRGFARFVRVTKGSVSVDREAIEADARLDGKFVLTTNTDLSPADVATSYKSLWRVERAFREEKSTLEVRPIYHHSDENSVGHIVASFLALRLEVDLQRRLEARACPSSWPDLMRDLGQVQAVTVELDGHRYRLRTELTGAASPAFLAAGVRPPSILTHLGAVDPPVSPAAEREVV